MVQDCLDVVYLAETSIEIFHAYVETRLLLPGAKIDAFDTHGRPSMATHGDTIEGLFLLVEVLLPSR